MNNVETCTRPRLASLQVGSTPYIRRGDNMREVNTRNLNRLIEQMGHIDELALVVLKGHLLLEEQLERIISKFLLHPEYLERANLRFAQKVALARTMSLDEQENSMWELLLAVNGLRNELA